jgi:hypothetical protein
MFLDMIMRVDHSTGPASFLDIEDVVAFETVSRDCREVTRSHNLMRSFSVTEDRLDSKKARGINEMVSWMFGNGRLHKNLTSFVYSCCNSDDADYPSLTDDSLMMVARCCPNLNLVVIKLCSDITEDAFVFLVNHCSGLTSINMDGCWDVGDRLLMAVATDCKNLTSLSAVGCNELTDEGIASIADGCQKLTLLNVAHCYLTIESMLTIAIGCPRLTTLNFTGCPGFYDSGYPDIDFDNYESIVTILNDHPNIRFFEPYVGDF